MPNKYIVRWETHPSPAAAYYSGTKEVYSFVDIGDENLLHELQKKVAGNVFRPSEISILDFTYCQED